MKNGMGRMIRLSRLDRLLCKLRLKHDLYRLERINPNHYREFPVYRCYQCGGYWKLQIRFNYPRFVKMSPGEINDLEKE